MASKPYHPDQLGTFEKRGATGKHDVCEQRAAQIHVRLVDGEDQNLMESLTLIPYQVWLEQQLRGPEPRWSHLRNTRCSPASSSPGIPTRHARPELTLSVLPSGRVYCTFSVSRASSFWGLMDR